jgi:hypothetical protein
MVVYLIIILIHWFADFVLQTDWQAKNKSTDNHALLSHTGVYACVWGIVSLAYYLATRSSVLVLLFPIITFVVHSIQDYFTSRLNSKLWKEGKIHQFFVSIGFDQVLHYVQLFLTYSLLV